MPFVAKMTVCGSTVPDATSVGSGRLELHARNLLGVIERRMPSLLAASARVPAGLRGRVWLGALRLGTVTERDYNYFGSLQREVGRVTLATDEMVRKDAAGPAREDDYFVFGELIEEVPPRVTLIAC